MKLSRPAAPFERVELHGESFTLDTSGKVLVLPTGSDVLLPSFNEYVLNSNRLTLAESPFGGMKGSGSPDYAPGTLYTPTDGVYLTDVNGQNSTKTLTAGKLVEIGNMTVDTSAHTITEEFVIRNDNTGADITVLDTCDSTTGWVVGMGTGAVSVESGRIKCVGNASSNGKLEVAKFFGAVLSGKTFIKFSLESDTSCNGHLAIATAGSTWTKGWNGTRFSLVANTKTTFIFPIIAPKGSTGSLPDTIIGTPDYANSVYFYIGLGGLTNGQAATFYVDDIQTCNGTWAQVEVAVPDNLSATSLSLYTHDGTAYQLCSTHSLDGAYSQLSQTSANFTYPDSTKFDDVYGTGLGRAVFPKASVGATVNGSTGSITYSENRGTDKRIGLKFNLPPSDNGRTNFNKVRLKLVVNYTDTVGNVVPDLSGNGNTGILIGGVTKLNSGGLQFDGSTGRVIFSNIPKLIDFTIIARVSLDTVTAASGEIIFRQGFQSSPVSIYVNSASQLRLYYTISNVWGGQSYSTNISTGSHTVIAARKYTDTTATLELKLDSGETQSTTREGLPDNSVNGITTIGYDTNSTSFLDGNVSELIVYDRYLTTEERTQAVNGTLPETPLIHIKPTVSNMGSTTHDFADSTNTSYGLQNLSKPWIALYDPANSLIDFYLFTHRPQNLSFKRNDDGTIHEVTLYPGNGLIYHGQITYANLTADSNSDGIPDCLEASVEGSLTKFLQAYGMVI